MTYQRLSQPQRDGLRVQVDERRRVEHFRDVRRDRSRQAAPLPSWSMPVELPPHSKLTQGRIDVLRMLLAGGLTRSAIAKAAWKPWGYSSADSLQEVIRVRQKAGELPPHFREDRIPEFSRRQAELLIGAVGSSPNGSGNGATVAA